MSLKAFCLIGFPKLWGPTKRKKKSLRTTALMCLELIGFITSLWKTLGPGAVSCEVCVCVCVWGVQKHFLSVSAVGASHASVDLCHQRPVMRILPRSADSVSNYESCCLLEADSWLVHILLKNDADNTRNHELVFKCLCRITEDHKVIKRTDNKKFKTLNFRMT